MRQQVGRQVDHRLRPDDEAVLDQDPPHGPRPLQPALDPDGEVPPHRRQRRHRPGEGAGQRRFRAGDPNQIELVGEGRHWRLNAWNAQLLRQ